MENPFHLWHNLSMTEETLASFIRRHRKRTKLSQKELAEVIQMTNRSVSEWEAGRRIPNRDALTKLAAVFQISLDEFKRFINVDLSEDIDAIVDATPPDELLVILNEIRAEGERRPGIARSLRDWFAGWRARDDGDRSH